MSDNLTGKTDLSTQAARVERDLAETAAVAEHVRRQEAEAVRDIALNAAATQAAQKEVAELIARTEAYNRQNAEAVALRASIAANQARAAANESVAESAVLRENLAAERKSASTANFGLIVISILLILALAGMGIWYFNRQSNANSAAGNGGATAVPTASSKPSEVSVPAPPPTIHVITVPAEPAQPTAHSSRSEPTSLPPASSPVGIGGADAIGTAQTEPPSGGNVAPAPEFGNAGAAGTTDAGAGKSPPATSPAPDNAASGSDKPSSP